MQFAARFSPDEKWVVFAGTRTGPAVKQIFITARDGGAGPQQWVPLTDGAAVEQEPYWSPDGKRIYYVSDRDGSRCIWARGVDPATGTPIGVPFPVLHFHHSRQMLRGPSAYTGEIGLSVSENFLVATVTETKGNVWVQAMGSLLTERTGK